MCEGCCSVQPPPKLPQKQQSWRHRNVQEPPWYLSGYNPWSANCGWPCEGGTEQLTSPPSTPLWNLTNLIYFQEWETWGWQLADVSPNIGVSVLPYLLYIFKFHLPSSYHYHVLRTYWPADQDVLPDVLLALLLGLWLFLSGRAGVWLGSCVLGSYYGHQTVSTVFSLVQCFLSHFAQAVLGSYLSIHVGISLD